MALPRQKPGRVCYLAIRQARPVHPQPLLLARPAPCLANFGKEGKPEPIIAKISQETLAEMIGTHPIVREFLAARQRRSAKSRRTSSAALIL